MTPSSKPSAWLPHDLSAASTWKRQLSTQDIRAIDAALTHAKTLGKPLLAMTRKDFPLPGECSEMLKEAFHSTQGRWGLCLIKGFPVDRWTVDETRLAFWGISLHVGVARPQNRASDVMTDVRDEGASYKVKSGRGYNTNAELDFHMDSCDVVALLCLQTAKRGGESKIFSSIALRQEIERQRPDLIEALREPVYHSYQGSQGPGQPSYFACPILGSDHEDFAFRTNRRNIDAAQTDFPDAPRLTDDQWEALDLMDQLMPDPRLCYSMWLERGDLQLLNNYVVGHSRTGYEDYNEPEKKRHLLRLWLAVPDSQRLPPEWAQFCGNPHAGAVRGGFRGSGITPEFLAYEARQAADMDMVYGPVEVATSGSKI